MRNIIILGPPYSGKSTQCSLISSFFGFIHLPTGEILRQEIKKQSSIGNVAESFVSSGLFAPDSLLKEIVAKYLDEYLLNNSGILFDGYPRNIAQLETLISLLALNKAKIDLILVLDIPNEEWHSRANNRAKLENRQDDQDSKIVSRRFELYNTETLPILKASEGYNIPIATISALGKNEFVFEKIKRIIQSI